jgi:hypothetical protein
MIPVEAIRMACETKVMAKVKDERCYDQLLLDHERRDAEGLPPSAEYKRLSDLAGAHLAAVEAALKKKYGVCPAEVCAAEVRPEEIREGLSISFSSTHCTSPSPPLGLRDVLHLPCA